MYRTERFLLFCDLKVKANLKKKISAYGKARIFAFLHALSELLTLFKVQL